MEFARAGLDTVFGQTTTSGERLSGLSTLPDVDYDNLEPTRVRTRQQLFADDDARCCQKVYSIPESRKGSSTWYHPDCATCQLREAARSPYSFVAMGIKVCRAFRFDEKELLYWEQAGTTIDIESSYIHGRSGCISMIAYTPKTIR